MSTIKNYRSAIAAIHKGFSDGSTIGNNNFVNQLLKGMANDRPKTRSLAPAWSISAVLSHLASAPYEPMHSSSPADLTHKTFFSCGSGFSEAKKLSSCTLRKTGPYQV